MSLVKEAQTMHEVDDTSLAHSDLWDDPDLADILSIEDDEDEAKDHEIELELSEDEDEPVFHGNGEVFIQVNDEPPVEKEFIFELPMVPGGEHQEDVPDEEVEVEAEDDEAEVIDENLSIWDWKKRGGVPKFMEWLQRMMTHIPSHSGYDSAGLERSISYLEEINKNISQAVRSDINCILDVRQIEKARSEIHGGIIRLKDRLDKIMATRYNKKKKAEVEEGMVKEAQKAPSVGGIIVTVPIFISHLARTCINSAVSAGKDMEKTLQRLCEKYKLSDREKVELITLITDMGYPIFKDRGMLLEDEVDLKSSDNFDWNSNYPA